jgi:hypothetical protein
MLSRVTYTMSGVVQPYTVPFPYIDQSHVEVRIAGVLIPTDQYYWSNASAITILGTAAASMEIRRNTPNELPDVVYGDGSTLTASDLNLEALQQLYINQELSDDVASITSDINDSIAAVSNVSVQFPATGTSPVLPSAIARASRALVFGPSGAVGVSAEAYKEPSAALLQATQAAEQMLAAITIPTFLSYAPTVLRSGIDYTAGSSTTVTLPTTASPKTISGVFFDGGYQAASQWSLGGDDVTLTFSSAIPLGISEINVAYFFPSKLGVFYQGGAGSVPRAFQSKMRDKVSVYDFMTEAQIAAVRAGWATDCGAIQAAITYILSLPNGGELEIPEGYFQVATPVDIPKTTKTLRVKGRGAATSIRKGSAGQAFNVGYGSTAGGGFDYIFSDFQVCAPASGAGSAFEAWNANTTQWERIAFGYGLTNGVVMHSCYATRFWKCSAVNLVSYVVYSYTSCHNIIFDDCKFYGVGGVSGSVLNIADGGATNNIVFQNCDLESCANIYSVPAGCSSIKVTGCYIEYAVNLEFFHRGICYGVDIDNNWIAYNTQGNTLMTGGGSQLLQNIHGGRWVNNTTGAATYQFDGNTCRDIDDGGNVLLAGSGQLGPSPFAPVTFLNAWTQGSRTIGFKKQQDGTVELRGVLNGSGAGTTAFQLPSGYRPAQQLRVPMLHESGNTFGALIIDSNGNVVPLTATGGSATIDGIRFIATPQ